MPFLQKTEHNTSPLEKTHNTKTLKFLKCGNSFLPHIHAEVKKPLRCYSKKRIKRNDKNNESLNNE